jgi:ferredoxin
VKEITVADDQSLFEALREAGQPIASSCLGVAVCGRCLVRVQSGAQSLSPIDAVERRVLLNEQAASNQRLACQCYVIAAGVGLSTDYW